MPDYALRRERLFRSLSDSEIPALLVSRECHVSYLTGFTGDSSMLLLGPGERAILISDGRYTEQLERECPGLVLHIRKIGQRTSEALTEVIEHRKIAILGIESTTMTVATWLGLDEALPSVTLFPCQGLIETLRAVKDDEEIAAIQRAIDLASECFLGLKGSLAGPMTEKMVADLLEFRMRQGGAESASFPPIVASGFTSAMPHYRPGSRNLEQGHFLLVDWGASLHGYKSDLTRIVPLDGPDDQLRKVHNAVAQAQSAAIAAIHPGQRASEVDRAARSTLESLGFAEQFVHSVGHGLGLEVHEAPSLRQESEDILQPGMVVTIEPGVYLPGWGGVRLEEDVLVTEDGHQRLSQLPLDLEANQITLQPS